MQERLQEKQRELVDKGFSKPYAMAIAHIAVRDERARTGKIVIKKTDREWWVDRMAARCKFYLDHFYEDTATDEWRIFVHDIDTQSGSHRHQGGLALFVLEGKGATIMDGKKYEWEKGDLVLLPIKPGEVEHQHINYGGNAKWIAFIYVPIWHAVASTLTQIKDRAEWTGGPSSTI